MNHNDMFDDLNLKLSGSVGRVRNRNAEIIMLVYKSIKEGERLSDRKKAVCFPLECEVS